jgi:S-DNA-T family DNA segregation ATPase FtsK/SpoIIIE
MQRETFCGVEDTLLFSQAVKIVIDTGYASVSLLQRELTIGYPLAARLIDIMYERGYIGPFEGSKPRRVLITKDYVTQYGKD